MKICYMTGAVINAGDFLIENRSLQILKKVYNEPEICIKKRVGINYDNFIDELNSFDLILFSGGPIYYSGVYSDKQIPFVSDLSCVKSKIAVCGGGGIILSR